MTGFRISPQPRVLRPTPAPEEPPQPGRVPSPLSLSFQDEACDGPPPGSIAPSFTYRPFLLSGTCGRKTGPRWPRRATPASAWTRTAPCTSRRRGQGTSARTPAGCSQPVATTPAVPTCVSGKGRPPRCGKGQGTCRHGQSQPTAFSEDTEPVCVPQDTPSASFQAFPPAQRGPCQGHWPQFPRGPSLGGPEATLPLSTRCPGNAGPPSPSLRRPCHLTVGLRAGPLHASVLQATAPRARAPRGHAQRGGEEGHQPDMGQALRRQQPAPPLRPGDVREQ